MNKIKKQVVGLLLTLLLVLVIVISFVLYNEWPLISGNKIVLSTQPIDPFDPFMGQYMSINYEISRVSNITNFKEGDIIYVKLKEDDSGIWRANGFSKMKPSNGDFIKGEVEYSYGNFVNVKYGIEQFYFEKNAQLPTTNITVEVAVSSSGRAKLVQLLHDGKPIEIDYEDINLKS